MLIIPAIDIIGGKCVRLSQGDYSKVKNYECDPFDVAKKFKKDGYKLIHVIDLEGAKEGKSKNLDKLFDISKIAGLEVQMGGGIRTFEDAKNILNSGIKRVILGTISLQKPNLVKRLIESFGAARVAVSLDIKNSDIMINGWTKKSSLSLLPTLNILRETGLEILIFTDINRDGMMRGVNFKSVEKVLNKGFKIIVAGGISEEKDIENLRKLGVWGAIVGKAFYEGEFKMIYKNDLAKRIIPCMDIKNGRVVKGLNFTNLKDAGDPILLAEKYSNMGADELVFLDITATIENRKNLYNLVSKVSEKINIPFTVGGGIREIMDIKNLLNSGADKVSIGSYAVENPDFIKNAAEKFGSQCVVVSIDAKKVSERWVVFVRGGRENTEIDAIEFAKKMEKSGAGELLVNSLDRDGTKIGYDIELLKKICDAVKIPVIASSGAGSEKDFLDVFEKTNVDAALAASLFHYGEVLLPQLKQYLIRNNITIRI